MGVLMRKRVPLLPSAGVGLALALCVAGPLSAQEGASAPDEAASAPSSARARRAEPLPSFTVEVTDGVFTPKALHVPAGKRVKIELVNHGPGPLEFENDEMNIEKVLGAGARSFVVLPPLAPGAHEFVDEFNPVSGVLVIHAR